MRSKLLGALVVAGLIAITPRAEANTPLPFLPGSLIIPSSSVFQSDCGAVSMYGLVYDVLRANKWLSQNGYNAITINYAVADGTATPWSASGKQSPNRCNPSDTLKPSGMSVANAADPTWFDGCDFQLVSGTSPTPANLVKLVKNGASAAANDTNVRTYATTIRGNVFPQYASTILGSNVSVNYGGGPFIIKDTDAATFLGLLDGTIPARDSANNLIDFSPFISPKPNVFTGSCNFGRDNYVNIHRAMVGFTASVNGQFVNAPPRLALLDTGGTLPAPPKTPLANAPTGAVEAGAGTLTTFTTTSAHGLIAGDAITVAGVQDSKYNGNWTVVSVAGLTFTANISRTGRGPSGKGTVQKKTSVVLDTGSVSGSILQNYLNNAGLNFTGAQGCPTGGLNVANTTICPIGPNPGQVYDAIDFQDLAAGKLHITDSGVPRYSMIWTPHWDTTANSTTGPNAAEAAALTSMRSFLDGQTGLFAECAAVTSFEGTWEGGVAKVEGSYNSALGGMQLQTCPNNAGSCGTTPTAFGFARNASAVPAGNLRNCTDITTADGSGCAYYAYPRDPFAQIADFDFAPTNGETKDWLPNGSTTSMYRPGVFTLISGVASNLHASLTNATTARALVVTDWATRNIKDNTPGKANVLYLGGHDLTGTVSGTKLVLLTLLQLGSTSVVTPPSTSEVSRATPIAAIINGNPAIVQGTFEAVTPAPLPPFPLTITAPADVLGWQFPAVLGHMRATVASSINTTAASFGSGTVVFDAAAGIPAVTNSGCATNFNGSCRTIFTTTATSPTGIVQNPAPVFFADPNADLLGNLMAPGLGPVGNPQWKMMVEKVLAGQPDGFGSFIPRLGGVDRSTVAVIETSSVAGTARPTVAYFGATDGMLHAVCASVTVPAGPPCDTFGRELWAFLPRTQLPFVRLNTARIDGSPHVADVFGDFTGSGVKSFRTILTFQTGSGTAGVIGSTPAVYALDITDPTTPTVVWEYTAPDVRTANELGIGLAMAGGPVLSGGLPVNMAFAETNNGGSGANGIVVAGINIETAQKVWQFNYPYPSPHIAADLPVPTSGIPGGAVAIDKTTQGFTSDLVFGDLYGNLWEVDPLTGFSRYGTNPLFEFGCGPTCVGGGTASDYHPIGALPAIYSDGNSQFAVVVTGGFADPSDATWGTATQSVVSISLNAPAASVILTENSGAPNVPFTFPLAAGEKGFTQALIVGGQLFFTSDTADVNSTGYGIGAQTGHMYSYTIGGAPPTSVVIAGGAGAVANSGTTLYTSSKNQQQQISTAATSVVGPAVDGQAKAQVTRKLWLRTL